MADPDGTTSDGGRGGAPLGVWAECVETELLVERKAYRRLSQHQVQGGLMPCHPPYTNHLAHKAPCSTTVLEGGLRLECGDPRAVGNGPPGTPGVLGRGEGQ